MTLRTVRSSTPRLLLSVLAAVAAQAAHAQEQGSSPYYLGASQAFTRDSNILRRELATSDTISSTGLRGGIDQSFGRQRAVVGAEVNRNRYNTNTQYNNTAYDANGRLDWSTIGNVSGTLSANAGRSLYRNTTYTGTERNLLTTSGAALQVMVGVVTRWSFDASLSTNRSSYSATDNLNLRQNGGGVGVRFQPSDALSLRTGVRRTKGSYTANPLAGGFTRDDIDFDSLLALSGASRLATRVSATRTDYDDPQARDFRGWTGSVGWNWRPTGKLQFDLTAARDNSVGSTNQYAQITNDFAGDTRISNSIGLRGAYELTSKIAFNAGIAYVRRTLENSFFIAPNQPAGSGKDNTKTASLSFRYMPLRNVELGCGYAWEDRNLSAQGLSTISFPYTARSYTCSGQVFLR